MMFCVPPPPQVPGSPEPRELGGQHIRYCLGPSCHFCDGTHGPLTLKEVGLTMCNVNMLNIVNFSLQLLKRLSVEI